VGAAFVYFLKFAKVDFNKKLPMKVTIETKDLKPEDVAYRFLYELIMPYQGTSANPWGSLRIRDSTNFSCLRGTKMILQ
jgi:hypothetical protein